jgi:hypothetical protein
LEKAKDKEGGNLLDKVKIINFSALERGGEGAFTTTKKIKV